MTYISIRSIGETIGSERIPSYKLYLSWTQRIVGQYRHSRRFWRRKGQTPSEGLKGYYNDEERESN